MKIKLLILITILLIVGCEKKEINFELVKTRVLAGDGEEGYVGNYIRFGEIVGNDLLIIDEENGCGLVYNINDFSFTNKIGEKGMGPGELILPMSFTKGEDNNYYIVDIKQQTLNIWDEKFQFVEKRREETPWKVMNLNDETYLCSGTFIENAYIKSITSPKDSINYGKEFVAKHPEMKMRNAFIFTDSKKVYLSLIKQNKIYEIRKSGLNEIVLELPEVAKNLEVFFTLHKIDKGWLRMYMQYDSSNKENGIVKTKSFISFYSENFKLNSTIEFADFEHGVVLTGNKDKILILNPIDGEIVEYEVVSK